MSEVNPLGLISPNHVSLTCHSLEETTDFYVNVLGFFPIHRPKSLEVQGVWLFGYGFGIHLLDCPNTSPKKQEINPIDKHISFQCQNIDIVHKALHGMKIEFLRTCLKGEDGIQVDQVFFHDPDGFMIEVCTCGSLPIIPLN